MLTKYTMSVAIAQIFGIDDSQLTRVDTKAYPTQMKYEGMNCGRMEALFLENSKKIADSFRSDFKTSINKHLRPFLPPDMLAQSLAGNDQTRAQYTSERPSLGTDGEKIAALSPPTSPSHK